MQHNNDSELAYFEEEMAWRKDISKRDTGREILELMSYTQAQEMLTPLLESCIDKKAVFDKEYKRITRLAKKHYAPDTFEFEFAIKAVWALKFMKQDMENQKHIEELEKYWLFNESRKPKTQHTPHTPKLNLEVLSAQAKQVPIETLCKVPYKKSGTNTFVLLCPFHTEKTPSFTIFAKTNTFFCFGCNVKGDAIAFYQKMYGFDFVEAVKRLTGQY